MASRTRRVVWTEAAQDHLDSVVSYIVQDSPLAGSRFLELVLETAQSLAWLSERGRVAPEIRRDNVREIFVYRYRLIYEVSESEVHILSFIHGSRDFAKLADNWR